MLAQTAKRCQRERNTRDTCTSVGKGEPMRTQAVGAATAPLPDRPELSAARRRLFETALALFSRTGYNGVSVRDIVAELDQHPTAIYAHVSSKQELLFEVILIGYEELRDRLRSAVLEAGSDPAAQLRAIVSTNASTHLTYPELARVIHSEAGLLSESQRAIIDVFRQDLGGLLREVAARGVVQGVFNPPDLEITLLAITSMGVNVIDWWTVGMGVDIAHIAATHADLAIRMLTSDT